MQKWKIVSVILVLFTITKMYAQDDSYDSHVKQYISQYKDWAMEEQRRTGVPAAITLAQGIHETSAGSSELALNANNHFGIKCKKEWKGDTYSYTDDAPNECFRKYKSAFNSYKDHSDYLRSGKRYDALFKLPVTDYKGWAVGLKRCGYATNPKYSQILIRLVENYDLQQYTYTAMHEGENIAKNNINDRSTATSGEVIPKEDAPVANDVKSTYEASKKSSLKVGYTSESDETKKVTQEKSAQVTNNVKPPFGKIITVNGLKAFYAAKGTMLLDEAVKNNIRYAKLLELNDLPDAPLEADMFIYLEKKNTKGNSETHLVKHGEILLQIAQQEGIQLKWLKFYNRIGGNEEISEGATVQLQQLADVKPATHPKVVMNEPMHDEPFSGANPRAIPQGATRMRAGYIRKSDIEKESNEPLKKLVSEEKEDNKQSETQTSEKTSVNNVVQSDNDVADEKEPASPVVNVEKKEVAITEVEKKTAVADDNTETKNAVPDTTTPIAVIKEEQKIEPAKEAAKSESIVVAKKEETKNVNVKELTSTANKVETVKEEVSAPIVEVKNTEIAKTETTTASTKDEPAKIATVTEEKKEVIAAPIKETASESIIKTDSITEIKKEELKPSSIKETVMKTTNNTTLPVANVNANPVNNESIQDPTVAEEASATKHKEKNVELTANIASTKNSTEENKAATQDKTVTEIKKPVDFSAVNPLYDTASKTVNKDNAETKEQETTSNAVATTTTNADNKQADATTKKVENYTTIPVAPLAGSKNKKDDAADEEPKNKFDRLKAKLDKVVYASDNIAENEKSDEQKVKKEEQDNKAKEEEVTKSKYYTVKKGDTFSSVLKENKITKHQLLTWNKLKNESLKVGQKLKVKP